MIACLLLFFDGTKLHRWVLIHYTPRKTLAQEMRGTHEAREKNAFLSKKLR